MTHKLGDGHPGYLKLLEDLKALHLKKTTDYGSDSDPLHNLRASEEVGIDPWIGAWMRAKDKVKRIDLFCKRRMLANESVEDSLMDLAAYSLLTLLLYREETGKGD